jgi:hypothetical protein
MKITLNSLLIGIYLLSFATVTVIPITEVNVHKLKGDWEGTRKGRHGQRNVMSAPVTMKIMSTSPIRAVILFERTPSGTLRYVLEGTIENGYIVGEMKGKKMPKIKLGLHRREDGRHELRGDYRAGRGVQFRGKLTLEKVVK